ncbi:hypothetical protein HKBW3S06_01565, partial [Candidatus Hakubella thermalkaliphila]
MDSTFNSILNQRFTSGLSNLVSPSTVEERNAFGSIVEE